ncbi:lactoylglutathione lyase [Dysgonomonas sp. PFB1-18]|uniref:VOC family protein n=1 Tax=unclassified Dysgonomonas TaxID=2630389 RepID=UPI002475D6E7|nr:MULTISPECIES: VOC family protein [unclassified Dysgonomonas]MDH6307590.1 lactoylglutathione lyase [Dysgonomonas sp. PF1-14]MDH6337508.1 lactoylglutathione lyase [Dysgonomonas sp. PF1-16]MDH6378733.1 lactoylglutathione lyase [Dysgonomonas sp. PFB1-18]MDH6399151.1 lactoylglutathione lyase [Dysgonomonas sp. PF1-23]
MRLHHTALWVTDLEKVKEYYIKHFGATSNEIYVNPITGFSSYFLTFSSGSQLEIMHRHDIADNLNDNITQYKGYIHLAFLADTPEEVDAKLKELQDAGYPILRGPRTTGDGYYEFETLDPEGNRLEVISK